MSILDLTNGVTDANDPRYYEDAKPLEAYLRPNKVRMYYLDEINDVYYIDLASYAGSFPGRLWPRWLCR